MSTIAEGSRGLTSAQAAERSARLGERRASSATRSARQILRSNTFTLVNGITLAFLVLIAAAQAWHDAVFAVVIAINTLIGVAQEIRAKRKLDRLALLVAPRARVRRDGEVRQLPPEEIVPDDVIDLQPGDQLVADGEVVESRSLSIDESILTGEANPVRKSPGDEVLSGAFCSTGVGVYRVTAVGEESFAARVTAEAQTQRDDLSPLQLEINRLLRLCLVVMIPLAAILIGALYIHGTNFQEAAQTATAGLISIVPEGLVLLTSVTFAAGALRLGRSGALVQRLSSVESLASLDTVCLDKTGTLTDGSLELVEVVPRNAEGFEGARRALARLAGAGSVRSATSDAIEAALGNVEREDVASEVPFSSAWKWSGVMFSDGDALVLGAPEALGAAGFADEIARRQATRQRVLVFGRARSLPEVEPDAEEADPPSGFEPMGLAVLEERMRPEAASVIAFLEEQGVDVKILSGDAPATVEAVARAAGFSNTRSMAGVDLPDDPEALADVAERVAVFGRVTPEDKRALIDALRSRGRFVAMVGDGVNDVPAMKRAQVAISFGHGSPIARGSADIVLLEGDFSAIPSGIREGRRILANIRRVAKLFVVKSAFAATLILTVGVAGAAYPLLPRHLSLAALFTVGVPAFALALAPNTGEDASNATFLRDLLRFSLPAGVVSALAVLTSYGATTSLPGRTIADARSVSLLVLVLTGLYLVLLLEDEAMAESKVRARGVIVLMAALLVGLVAALSDPTLRSFFAVTGLGPPEVLLAILGAVFAVGALGILGFPAPLVVVRFLRRVRPALP